jgi:predicted DCC family thiol-disulfide oxidoreductase YuxK
MDLLKRAIAFVQRRYPTALIVHTQVSARRDGVLVKQFFLAVAMDHRAGMTQRVAIVPKLGAVSGEIDFIVHQADRFYSELTDGMEIVSLHEDRPHDSLSSFALPKAARVLIYTDDSAISAAELTETLRAHGVTVELIEEKNLLRSAFISYGGPDELAVTEIYKALLAHGVQLWFFPVHSVPGQKLHRMMSDGVDRHDRVLFVCSEDSLRRPGVLNELERVLEREAREGGSEVLIPITLDDYVYKDWAPTRPDIANQIRSRVIPKIRPSSELGFIEDIRKIVSALRRKN